MTRHYGARVAPPWSRSMASRTPIASSSSPAKRHRRLRRGASVQHGRHAARLPAITREIDFVAAKHDSFGFELRTRAPKIGRASWRERVFQYVLYWVGAV